MQNSPAEKPDVHSEDFLRSLMRRQLKLDRLRRHLYGRLAGFAAVQLFLPELMATRVFGFTHPVRSRRALFPFVWLDCPGCSFDVRCTEERVKW
jgi:hypothetical protein